MCWRKHTGRQDTGASQCSGDRTALRAASPTQRGLRTLLTLRWRGGKELSLSHSEHRQRCKGAGADFVTKIQPAGIWTKSGGARSIVGGKGPAGSGLSLGVAGVENGGRKDATFLPAAMVT